MDSAYEKLRIFFLNNLIKKVKAALQLRYIQNLLRIIVVNVTNKFIGKVTKLETSSSHDSKVQSTAENSVVTTLNLENNHPELKNSIIKVCNNLRDENNQLFLNLQSVQEDLENSLVLNQEHLNLVDQLSSKNEELMGAIDVLNSRFLTLEHQHEDSLGSIKHSLSLAKIEVMRYQDQLNDCQFQLKKRIDSLSALSSKSDDLEALNEDLKELNQRILLQLNESQEELEHLLISNSHISNELKYLRGRWSRLELRAPQYFDYDMAEVNLEDGELEGFTLLIKDYYHNGTFVKKILIRVTSEDGITGIDVALVNLNDIKGLVEIPRISPGTFVDNPSHANSLNSLPTLQYSIIESVRNFFTLLVNSQWRGVTIPLNFDRGFWSSTLQNFIKSYDNIPKTLHFDSATLKRELVNSEYEHLWLELHNLKIGQFTRDIFEIRIGAANINKDAFSRLPKIEIPLIGGMDKPFPSWYPESSDDFGPKYELRLNLDKRVFDLNAWFKLSEADRFLLYNLILALPRVMESIESLRQLSRPWVEWKNFVRDSIVCIQLGLRAIQLEALKKNELIKKQGYENPNAAKDSLATVGTKRVEDVPERPKKNSRIRKPVSSRESMQTKKKSNQL